MNVQLAESNPIFICVLVGGIVTLGNLLPRLNFQLEINYLHLTSYDRNNTAGRLCWKAKPTIELLGRTVVLVDDILDSGTTLQAAIDYCHTAGATTVLTAVLLEKQRPRNHNSLRTADYQALTVADQFVYGYGLDYSEYLRNAPGIYTIASHSR